MKMSQAFPNLLKHWRNTRRMSQLDLGLAANVSARHVSFLETGRSAPSRSMVLQLCDTLAVPLAAQNTILHAAGFAELYLNRNLNSADLALAKHAIDWTLQQHSPFPAIAFDRHWSIINFNRTAQLLLTAVGLKSGDSMLQALIDSTLLRKAIQNWDEVLQHMISRLRTESAKLGNDPILDAAMLALTQQLRNGHKTEHTSDQAVLSTRYSVNGMQFSLFSMLAQFGSAEDIALADLKIELMFPADAATRQLLLKLAGSEVAAPPA
jgi:transcriptional regulator with XRE-family HTH domain